MLYQSIYTYSFVFSLGEWIVKSITIMCKQENLVRKLYINFTAFLSIFLCLGDLQLYNPVIVDT